MPTSRRVLSLVIAAAAVVGAPVLSAADESANRRPAPGAPLAIHLISGSGEYKSEPSLRALQARLEERYKVSCTASWGRDGAKSLENLDKLADAELLVVFARRMKLDEQQMQLIRRHWQQGKPVMGIRTAGHAFGQTDNELFDREVLGGHYQGHYGNESVQLVTPEGAVDHPVLAGVGEFRSRKLYKAGPLAAGAVVLQIGKIEKAAHPVTIAHSYRGGRTFFTSLGVPDDFQNAEFLRMLENAVFWTTHRQREKMAR